ncbi:MAG TPA: hypothetical protein DEA43_04945 [Candidatus Moranbacteria bacterium]|nr:hypothetical protein [Candidatus Moranbacteria bacterium]HBT46199.1 hypothetical protein [Candidatus Moranbacteria bacterium]
MFKIRQSFGLHTPVVNAVLSLVEYSPSNEKDVTSGVHIVSGRRTVDQHAGTLLFESSEEGNKRIDHHKPTLVISVRNTLANLRCGAWVKSKTEGFVTIVGENSNESKRPYHILGMKKDGKMEITELFPTQENLAEYEWVFSGVPILWEDYLYERMITEAADHAHIWHLPRGNHPKTTEQTSNDWKKLHDVFRSMLYEDRKTAAKEISSCAVELGLKKEISYYLHNAIGLDENGQLIQLSSIGSLEKLGTELSEMGAKRALMVDNGGSVSVWFYPKGFYAKPGYTADGIPLFSLPNHRPEGTAYLFLQLESPAYEYLYRTY